MKLSVFIVLAFALSCSSNPKKTDWDSGANRENAFQEESMSARDSSVKDQLPTPTPKSNQSPSQ